MKPCPFCAEEIQDAAIKCRHCGEFLEGAPVGVATPTKTRQHSTTSIVIALLAIGPFALPLVWMKTDYSLLTKMLATLAVLALTYGCYLATMAMYDHLMQQLEALNF